MTPRVLVVDDDRAVRGALEVNLAKAGFEVTLASRVDEAIALLRERSMDVVLTDVKMPGLSGLDLLDAVRAHWPRTRVVMMTGHGTVEDAVRALKSGADDYLTKPISRDELLIILQKALREKALLAEVEQLRDEVTRQYGFENLVGITPAMRSVYELVDVVAKSDALVLITGPTGTGKELIAHAIHYRSRRKNAPLVRVNCAALPEGLLESELFGHEKGAFTGAIRQHRGKFEQAEGGTVLLDEIGEISPATQVKLLRIIEVGELQRVGGTDTLRVDVRIVAATNRDLRKEVRDGRFREDLFYRLHVVHVALPPLRERRDDIPLLVDHFVRSFAERHGKPIRQVRPAAMEQLMAHSWPGNVRELEHVIERAVILAPEDVVAEVQFSEAPVDEEEPRETTGESVVVPPGGSIADVLLDTERRLIVDALRAEKGVQARAAKRLGISRSNLNYRIQKLGIEVRDVVIE